MSEKAAFTPPCIEMKAKHRFLKPTRTQEPFESTAVVMRSAPRPVDNTALGLLQLTPEVFV